MPPRRSALATALLVLIANQSLTAEPSEPPETANSPDPQTAPEPPAKAAAPRRQRIRVIPNPTVHSPLPQLGINYGYSVFWGPYIGNGVYITTGRTSLQIGPGGPWSGYGWWPFVQVDGVAQPGPSFGLDWVPVDPNIGFTSTARYWPGRIFGPPMVEIDRRIDPSRASLPATSPPEPAPPPPPPTVQQLALEALRAGDFERADSLFERVTAEQDDLERTAEVRPLPDRRAHRLRAITLAALRRFDEAADLLNRAHAADPSLADQPLDPAMIRGGSTQLRRLVTSAVQFAERERSPAAWRLVGYLMLAEGRPRVAESMFERAEALASEQPHASQGLPR